MDECTLDKTMSCAVATACLKKVCKCGFKIPSRAANVGEDNELREKDIPENFSNAIKLLVRKHIADFLNNKTHLDQYSVVTHVLHQLVDKMGGKLIKQCPTTKKWYIVNREMYSKKISNAICYHICHEKNKMCYEKIQNHKIAKPQNH